VATTKQKVRTVGVTADPKRPFSERNGKLMIPAEAADYMGVSERQVWRLIGRKELPRVKVGKLVRIHIDDLDAYINSQREVG
jgi:excisionase family DNA binding protein